MAQIQQTLSTDTKQLYQQALLQHHKNPVGFEAKFKATHEAEGFNAACGDEIVTYAKVDKGKIIALAFSGDSCAICRASASIMCQYLIEHHVEKIEKVIEDVISAINSPAQTIDFQINEQLQLLLSVRNFPVRKQCAILPWRTFTIALLNR